MARGGQRQSGARRTPQRTQRRGRPLDNEGIIPVLARAVREVENAVERRSAMPGVRTKFQVVALLVREERARIKADTEVTEAQRAEQLKRLDGIATILAKTAARDTSLFALLAEDAVVSDSAKALKREMILAGGLEAAEEEEPEVDELAAPNPAAERRVVPQSVIARQLSNPFLVPDFSAAQAPKAQTHRLVSWELLGPLFRSFEYANAGATSCMELPEPTSLKAHGGLELMRHQAQLVASAEAGHRTFLLADEPGLGKTAQALLAAEAAHAYPLLVVVPNVVKTNWAREVGLWTPRRTATVIHGDGETIDGFADIVIVNYEVLDRHVGWIGDHGFRGMVVDEAHFIKNKSSQRSQHVLEIAERIRQRTDAPADDGADRHPADQRHRGLPGDLAVPRLDRRQEAAPRADGRARGDRPDARPTRASTRPRAVPSSTWASSAGARSTSRPTSRPAGSPTCRSSSTTRPVARSATAERELARRLVERYEMALATRTSGKVVEGIDHDLVRQVATWEREDTDSSTGENVFSMMRRIGQAKAGLAADYAAQLARNVGKVVFFAKHIDVMDVAEETFAKRGIRYSSIRGDQTPKARQKSIDDFVNDPDVEVVVCSLTAAGVGLNLQVASNLVLAELSWTDAEQTQAIDRVHRIGQSEPVTAWRVIAAQTIDSRIAELIDSKAGLAARALDGAGEAAPSSVDVQLEALVTLLTDALEQQAV